MSTPAASTCLPLRLSSRMLTHGNQTGQLEDHLANNRCDLGAKGREWEDQGCLAVGWPRGGCVGRVDPEDEDVVDRDHNRPGSGWTIAQQQIRKDEQGKTGKKRPSTSRATGAGTGYLRIGRTPARWTRYRVLAGTGNSVLSGLPRAGRLVLSVTSERTNRRVACVPSDVLDL